MAVPPSQIELSQMTVSILHEIMTKVPPTTIDIPNLGTTVKLPSEPSLLSKIWQDIRLMETSLHETVFNSVTLSKADDVDLDSMSIELNEGLASKFLETKPMLNRYLISLSNVDELDNNPEVQAANRKFYEDAIEGMCKRLAVVSVDYLRDKVITSRVLS